MNISPEGLRILTLLYHDTMVTYQQADLASSTGWPRAKVVETVAELMAAGLMGKASDSNTGIVCYITDAGRTLLQGRGILST